MTKKGMNGKDADKLLEIGDDFDYVENLPIKLKMKWESDLLREKYHEKMNE